MRVLGPWQDAGLLALLLGVFALAQGVSKSDEVACTLTFYVLELSNWGLIFSNLFWSRPALLPAGAKSGSYQAFLRFAVATVSLLATILGVPMFSGLFLIATPLRSCCWPESDRRC